MWLRPVSLIADVRELPDLQQHEDSVINTVTIEGHHAGQPNVNGAEHADHWNTMVLDGLAATERVNVIRRILRSLRKRIDHD